MRRFFDVVPHNTPSFSRRFQKVLGWEKVINLRAPFYRRSPLLAALLVLGVISSFYGSRLLFTRADAINFHPTACLGTWSNPTLAQGQPQSLVAGAVIDSTNAALWQKGEGNIFCGGFVPEDFTPRGNIISVGLTLNWKVGEEVVSFPQDRADVLEVEASSTINAEDIRVETSTPNIDISKTTTAPTSWWSRFLPIAIARESSVDIPVEAEVPSIQTVVSSEDTTQEKPDEVQDKIIELPPITASIDEPATSSEVMVETSTSIGTTTPALELPEPVVDENFLRVSYSLDGSNWEEIARINESNWKNLTASLSATDWKDLKNLQIKIESIDTTTNPLPPVYLDGMFLEVKYEVLSFFSLSDTVSSEDIILLPTSLKGDKKISTPETVRKIAAFLNPKYAGIVGPDSYDERRTIWFGWCGVMNAEVGDINICDDSSEPVISVEEENLLTVGMGKSNSNVRYLKTEDDIRIEMNLINDGWRESTSTQPIDLIVEYPERLSLSDDGTIIYLDEGLLEIKTPPDYIGFSITTSTTPGFKKATYSFQFEALPLGSSRQIIMDLWKR
ncbi:MAG: hypothetical protein AAB903_03320 [Patescibacteria group bacterium]